MENFIFVQRKSPIHLSICGAHKSALLGFICSDSSIRSAVVFSPLWNSHHVLASVFIDLILNSKVMLLFASHLLNSLMLIVIVFRHHMGDVSRKGIFILDVSAAKYQFCE